MQHAKTINDNLSQHLNRFSFSNSFLAMIIIFISFAIKNNNENHAEKLKHIPVYCFDAKHPVT